MRLQKRQLTDSPNAVPFNTISYGNAQFTGRPLHLFRNRQTFKLTSVEPWQIIVAKVQLLYRLGMFPIDVISCFQTTVAAWWEREYLPFSSFHISPSKLSPPPSQFCASGKKPKNLVKVFYEKWKERRIHLSSRGRGMWSWHWLRML